MHNCVTLNFNTYIVLHIFPIFLLVTRCHWADPCRPSSQGLPGQDCQPNSPQRPHRALQTKAQGPCGKWHWQPVSFIDCNSHLQALDIVSWEPEGRYCRPKMFRWEPEGRYRCTKSMAISQFWFSTEHLWSAITPFWLSTDDISCEDGSWH